jgi:hypothetical protein
MKPIRLLTLGLAIMLLLPALPALGSQPGQESPLLTLLRFVPDTPNDREMVTFGDVAAWDSSWGVPQVRSVDELNALPRDPKAYWMVIMGKQTAPPNNLGAQYVLQGDMRPYYGFDFFNVDRFIADGAPPDDFTVAEHNLDPAQIGAALTASGYTAQTLDGGATLYSLLGDYEIPPLTGGTVPRVGMTGALNRIALLGQQLIISRASANVTAALDAQSGAGTSLADDPAYAAAVQALDDPSLSDMGDLVGVMMVSGEAALQLGMGLEVEGQPASGTLPLYTLVAFATHHTQGASYLTLVVVFPAGADARAAADTLAERIKTYVSQVTGQPLTDRWTFDRSGGVEANGLPVALVTMRVDDPPVAPEGERANAAVLSWADMVYRRDLGYLAVGQPAQ